MVDFTSLLQTLKQKTTESLQSDSFNWYLEQIRKMAKLTKLRIQEYAEKASNKLSIPSATSTTEDEEKKSDLITEKLPDEAVMGQAGYISQALIGKMVLYNYDPLWKKELPYYDVYPLVIPISYIDASRYHGLNLHYLPPYERAQLLDALIKISNLKELDEKSRLTITYDSLKFAPQLRSYRPCFKEYLTSHIRSVVYEIHPNEWANVLTLPLASFQKQSQYKVWRESLKEIYK